MWCGSRPASTSTCTVRPALKVDRLEDVAHHRAGEVAADQVELEAGGLAAVHEVGAAGDVDDGLRERLVERHEGVAEAGDAAPCRRAPAGWRVPSTMPVSSTVWCTSMSVSPVAVTVRSVSECFANAVSRWSKNGTEVSIVDAPVPSRSRRRSMLDSLVSRCRRAVRGRVRRSGLSRFGADAPPTGPVRAPRRRRRGSAARRGPRGTRWSRPRCRR